MENKTDRTQSCDEELKELHNVDEYCENRGLSDAERETLKKYVQHTFRKYGAFLASPMVTFGRENC